MDRFKDLDLVIEKSQYFKPTLLKYPYILIDLKLNTRIIQVKGPSEYHILGESAQGEASVYSLFMYLVKE